MNWFWLNIPLMALFFLATAGIPLWLVIRHPDRRPTQERPVQAAADRLATAYATSRARTEPITTIELSGARAA